LANRLRPAGRLPTKVETLREMYPNVDVFQQLGPESRLVVSESRGSRVDARREVPRSY
jgi:hypothetical protein